MEIIDKSKKLQTSNWKFLSIMTICVFVWALAFPFIKIGLKELSFINLTIMRFLVVCITFITLLLIKTNSFSKLYKKDILPIFLLGFFGVIVYNLGLNYGEQLISPGAASLIIATIPVFIVIFALILLRERIGLIKLLGIIISLCGVLIISALGTKEAVIRITYFYAAIAVLIAAIMGALYTIAGKKFLERYNGLSLTAYAILLGSLGLIPFISKSLFDEVAVMSINGWIAVLFLGLCSTVVGYVIWYVALKIKTASEISVFLYAIPIISTIVSFFWLGYHITEFFVLGGILVLSGLIIVNYKKQNKKS